ncbi:MAG: energy-coupling factor transporter ATPase [Ruminococcaceae bacterium]|nr:energy-coupling factor transporter ATPase [Oscillospiraceae bacterium]
MDDYIKYENVSYSYEYDYEDSEEEELNDMNVPRSISYAVKNISFSVKKGEFIAIIGRNGSGKSTLARLTNALIQPTEGKVYINSKDTSDPENLWNIRSSVGMVFQNPDNQIIGTTVEDDVAFGLENLGVPSEKMKAIIDEAIHFVGLDGFSEKEPHLLSGGQKQRVAIAGVIAMRPDVIILDEATAMLDPIGRKEVMSVVRRLNKEENITVLHITHHMDEVADADRVILIDEGALLATGTPKELFSQGDMMRKAGLEVPQITRLFELLRESGVDLPKDVINVDDAVCILEKIIEK